MCDYCGCRRQAAIDELSEEHERLLDLTYGLRKAAKRADHAAVMTTLADEIVPLLQRHTDKEERGLFTQLRQAWGCDTRLDTLIDEHRDIEERIERIRAAAPAWPDEVRRLANDLSAHIMDEETDLFPYAVYELDDAHWSAIDAVHASSKPVAARSHLEVAPVT